MAVEPSAPQTEGRADTQPSAVEQRSDALPGDDAARFVEEELPPDFWEGSDAQHETPPEDDPARRSAAAEERRTPGPVNGRGSSQASASAPASASASASVGPAVGSETTRQGAPPGSIGPVADEEDESAETDDVAFATLQRLFPGRVISVEAPVSDDVGELESAEPREGGEAVVPEADYGVDETSDESRD